MRRSGAEFRLWSQLGRPNRCPRRDRGARMLLPPRNCYRDAEKIHKLQPQSPSHYDFEPNLFAHCTQITSLGASITGVHCGAGGRAGFGTSFGGSGWVSKFPPNRSSQPEVAASCTKVGNRATPGASITSVHCGGHGVGGARRASVAGFRSNFGGSCAVWEWRVNGGSEQWARRLHQPQGGKQRRTRTRGEASVQEKEQDVVGARGGVDLVMASTEDVYKNLVVPSRSVGAMANAVVGGGGRRAGVQNVKSILEEIAEVESENNVADVMNSSMWVQSQNSNTADVEVKNILRFQSEMVRSGENTFNPPRKLYTESRLKQRRTTSDPIQFIPRPRRQGSLKEFRNDMHHAATETYMITRLAITLLKLLGIGTRWISKLVRLGLYALFLMPGFIQVGFFYYFGKCVHRSIVYGDQPRNRFDLYLPPDGDKAKPAVIFVTGGAWIIGYKAWGSLLAQQLVERDIIVACIDYRNFPQGCVSDMVTDVSTGIGYVCQNIESYGGDPSMIYLAGQSAGAHLAACALLMQAKKEITDGHTKLSWRSSDIQAYMAISGGYNLVKLVDHFNERGLYKSLFLSVMEGEESLPLYSPEYMVMSPSFKDAVPLLPPITLFHGMADYSIPHEASKNFKVALQLVGAKVNTVFYPGKSHTDLFLQDPMRGGKDELLHDILEIIHENDEEARQDDAMAMKRRRLVPEILLQLARLVSPF